MEDDMTINGTKLPWAAVISVLIFTFWLGGLSLTVISNAADQKVHEEEPAHAAAALVTNTVQADVKHNVEEIGELKEDVKEVNEKLDDLKEQQATDKAEIIEAIRSHEAIRLQAEDL